MTGQRIDFLYLNEADMIAAGVTDMAACMDAMKKMFAAMGVGDYVMGGASRNSHGLILDFPEESPFPNMPLAGTDRRFLAMPAYLGGDFDSVGVKWYGSNVANRRKGLPRSIHLFTLTDKETGAPLAVMSANLLSAYRTGAIPGVGASYLARPDSRVIGIVGPGVMNTTALESFLLARPSIERVKIAGRSADSAKLFRDRARAKHPAVTIEIVSGIEEAVRESDIVSVATSSPAGSVNYPFIDEKWLAPGALLAAPATINLDPDFVLNRARNVADSSKLYETYAEEFGAPAHEAVGILGVFWNDLIAAGRMDRAMIGDLGSIIAGRAPGRISDDEIILLGIGGMPVEDVAWATTLYRNAVQRGIGTTLNLWDEPALA
ncbi:ornithine cyclodeaminase [Mycolicibacterium sp. CH28]|uniref:tyramine oxidase subunit B n=1 Tax=Mycolicibacterium sp. CH28 TaxID=2512237 RepID=UPI00107FFBE5|nr:tyramine oxidase subunit B [Mycolicibacterium sp. CH28]TGD87868.1 ornithine cyclodeaminase [Mycolicibacterium sp. CH28]